MERPMSSQDKLLTVDAGFPGGNVIVDSVEGDSIRVHQDLRDTEGDWFWWCFRVRGAAGRRFSVELTASAVIGPMGPAVSLDGGLSWDWLGPEAVSENRSFSYAVPAGAREVRFAFAMPYLEADLERWLAGRAGRTAALSVEELCRSRKDRAVELLRLGRLGGDPRFRIMLIARHHCCESVADWVLEGVMEAILAGDELGAWFRENVEAMVVPFADKDGVEDGDQGKNRRPRDHGRDYAGESLYPEQRRLRELVPGWSGGLLRFAADVHCPWIRGTHNEDIYQVGLDNPEMWRQQRRFGEILRQVQRGPWAYDPAQDLPFGVDWNKGGNFAQGTGFSRWIAGLPGIWLSTAMEIPYAAHAGVPTTPERARLFGRDLAAAIRRHLEETEASQSTH
jgi:hypothetical protein